MNETKQQRLLQLFEKVQTDEEIDDEEDMDKEDILGESLQNSDSGFLTGFSV